MLARQVGRHLGDLSISFLFITTFYFLFTAESMLLGALIPDQHGELYCLQCSCPSILIGDWSVDADEISSLIRPALSPFRDTEHPPSLEDIIETTETIDADIHMDMDMAEEFLKNPCVHDTKPDGSLALKPISQNDTMFEQVVGTIVDSFCTATDGYSRVRCVRERMYSGGPTEAITISPTAILRRPRVFDELRMEEVGRLDVDSVDKTMAEFETLARRALSRYMLFRALVLGESDTGWSKLSDFEKAASFLHGVTCGSSAAFSFVRPLELFVPRVTRTKRKNVGGG